MDLRLIYLLAGPTENVCMILDPDQSIYGFRGTDINAVVGMVNVFKDTKVHVLNRNYRSTQTIVEASKEIIDINPILIEKSLCSNNEKGNKIQYFVEKSGQAEAVKIMRLVNYCVSKGFKYSDIAVLYRMRYQSKTIEDTFLKYNIPYHLFSGIDFYSRAEVKDIMSYFKLLLNPNDSVAFKRAIAVPKRGIGNITIEKIIEYSTSKHKTILEACEEMLFTGKAKKGIESFLGVMSNLSEVVLINNERPETTIEQLIKDISYLDYLSSTCKEEDNYSEKCENLNSLMEIAATQDDIRTMVENMTLTQEPREDEDEDGGVQMMTMHMSKGLEWKVVIIVDAVEGINPSYMAKTAAEFEEERRVFYVAMTRAKKLLFILAPLYSVRSGQTFKNKESRYISDIDSSYIKRYDFRDNK